MKYNYNVPCMKYYLHYKVQFFIDLFEGKWWFIFMVILEAGAGGAVELCRVTPTGVANILSITFLWIRSQCAPHNGTPSVEALLLPVSVRRKKSLRRITLWPERGWTEAQFHLPFIIPDNKGSTCWRGAEIRADPLLAWLDNNIHVLL